MFSLVFRDGWLNHQPEKLQEKNRRSPYLSSCSMGKARIEGQDPLATQHVVVILTIANPYWPSLSMYMIKNWFMNIISHRPQLCNDCLSLIILISHH